MQSTRGMQLYTFAIIVLTIFGGYGCGGRKSKTCPAYHEAQQTGGTIDRNRKRKKPKVQQGVFSRKEYKRYR